MATQLETLGLIFESLVSIYDKLCEIQEELGGGDKPITIQVSPFFEADGSLKLDADVTTPAGGTQADVEFTDRLTDVLRSILAQIDLYADNPDIDWEEP